jgi:hypothetical protein
VSRGSGGEAALLVRVAVAALVGGAIGAAALAVARDVDRPELVAGLVVVVAAASVLVAATLAERPAPGWRRPAGQTAGQPTAARATAGQPAPGWPGVRASQASGTGGNARPARWNPAGQPKASPPEPAGQPMSVAIPVQGGAWWQAAAAGARPPAAGPSAHSGPAHSGPAHSGPAHSGPPHGAPAHGGPDAPAVEPADYAAATRVVQCPGCGDFRVDVRQQDAGFAFTCNRCDRHWRWEPGSAWPVAVVRPGRQARPAPGLRSEPS